jgi:ABC-type uncharacterized transport system permease subunit
VSRFLSIELIRSCIRIATPLWIGALAGIFSERSGVVNIALEGMMLAGAFGGAVVSLCSGQAWIGVLAAIMTGIACGLFHAVVSLRCRANQVISGVAINMLMSGLTIFLMQILFGNKAQSPTAPRVLEVTIPWFDKIPIIGRIIFEDVSPITLIGLLLVVVTHIILYYTRWGLRMRAISENPQAAIAAGVHVHKLQYLGVITSGALAGFAGSFLSIGVLDVFTKNMTAGRGFMSLAVMIFGRWKPFGSLAASLFFGYAMALQISLQEWQVPPQFVEMIPYFATLVVLAFVSGKVRPPAATGKLIDR